MSAALDDAGPDPASYRLARSVGHLLRRAHQRHAALFQLHAAEAGLTPPQFAALAGLSELGRATQNALGRAVAMDSATIQGVVQRLAARGLVAVTRDPMDRRTLVLTLSDNGRALLEEAVLCARKANAELLAGLSEAEQTSLLALLRRVVA
jgi:DNA-binding MarR family transcriptional regulator